MRTPFDLVTTCLLSCVVVTTHAAPAMLGEHAPARQALPPAALSVALDKVVATQQLHYRTLYESKPFPEATITYHANGVYRITSEGEDHYGAYVMQGRFEDETYTVRYISLPSPDWGDRTAFHQLTFINQHATSGLFIQDAVTDTGVAIARQNGSFSTQRAASTVEGPEGEA